MRSRTSTRSSSAATLLQMVKQDKQERQSGQALLAVHQEKRALAAVRNDRTEEVRAVAATSGRSWVRVPATQEPAR